MADCEPTVHPLRAPTLTRPRDKEVITAQTARFQIVFPKGANKVRIDICPDPTCRQNMMRIDSFWVQSQVFAARTLPEGATLYWRATGYRGKEKGQTSRIREFRTAAAAQPKLDLAQVEALIVSENLDQVITLSRTSGTDAERVEVARRLGARGHCTQTGIVLEQAILAAPTNQTLVEIRDSMMRECESVRAIEALREQKYQAALDMIAKYEAERPGDQSLAGLVALIQSRQGRCVEASSRAAQARQSEENEFDVSSVCSPPINLFVSVLGGTPVSKDFYLSHGPRLDVELGYSLWQTGNWQHGVQGRGWINTRERSPVVYQYPGEDPLEGPARKQFVGGFAFAYLLRTNIWRLAFQGHAGFAAQYSKETGDDEELDTDDWQFGLTLGLGTTVYTQRTSWGRFGFTVRFVHELFRGDFNVYDYRFSLAGTPGQMKRPLVDSGATLAGGLEIWL